MYNIDMSMVHDIVSKITASRTVENVAFVGCGASKSELYPGKYFLTSAAKKLRSYHYTAAEFNNDTPDWLGENTVVITASLGGNTPETVQANSVAKAAGAAVVNPADVADGRPAAAGLNGHSDNILNFPGQAVGLRVVDLTDHLPEHSFSF